MCPLGKLEPPSGAAMTRTSTPATGRGRRIKAFTTVATRAVPHAPIRATASSGSQRQESTATMTAGMIAALRRKTRPRDRRHGRPSHGCDQRWSFIVTARSIASLRRARTRPKIATKPRSPRRPARSAPRPRRTAVRGATARSRSEGTRPAPATCCRGQARGAWGDGAGRSVTRGHGRAHSWLQWR